MAKKKHKPNSLTKIALGILLVIFGLYLLLEINAQRIYHANPMKQNAAIMLPFATQYNLEKVYEYNNPKGIDNSVASFQYKFQSDRSVMELASVTNIYLYANGYVIRNLYIEKPCQEGQTSACLNNGEKPYWSLKGPNKNKEMAEATIREVEGRTLLDISFSTK